MVWPHPHTQSAEVALLRPHPNKLHAEAARFQDWAPITSLARLDANAPTVSVQRRQIRRCSATDPKSKRGKRSKRSKDNEIHSASTLPPAGPRPQASSARLSQATQITSIYGPAGPGSIWYEHRSVSALEAFKANCSDRQPPDGHRESIQTVTTEHTTRPPSHPAPQARMAPAAARSCSPGRCGHKLARCGRVSGRAMPLGRTGRRPQPAGVPDTSLTTTSEPVAAGKRCCDSVYGGAAISTGAAIGTVHRRQRRVQRT